MYFPLTLSQTTNFRKHCGKRRKSSNFVCIYKEVSNFYTCISPCIVHLTLSKTTNFRLFQTEGVCRRQFPIWMKRKKVFKWVDNTVEKGDIARYEQFVLFQQCFHRILLRKKPAGHVWERRLVKTLWEKENTSLCICIRVNVNSF